MTNQHRRSREERKKSRAEKARAKLTAVFNNIPAPGITNGHSCLKGFPTPRRIWDARCNVCEGSGFVRGLAGMVPCAKCCPEE